jgi:DNA polymerase V
MTALEQFSPSVEIYSIDEAFVNFEGFEKRDLTAYCREIRQKLYQWTGIPVTIGLASTKTLAKVANRYAKRHKEYKGVLSLLERNDTERFLKATKVSSIWGVGRKYSKMLNSHGIYSAYEFSLAAEKWVKKRMTVMGLRTLLELRGTACITMESSPPAKKAIISSRSFGRPAISKKDISEAVGLFAARAAEKMRLQRSAATLMTVFLRTDPFKKDKPQYHNGCQIEMSEPVFATNELLDWAMKAVDQIYREGYQYKKVGVMLTGFVPHDIKQIPLFEPEHRARNAKLTELLDSVNSEMGRDTLFFAATGIERNWSMNRDYESPHYTTDWKQLPVANAGALKHCDNCVQLEFIF